MAGHSGAAPGRPTRLVTIAGFTYKSRRRGEGVLNCDDGRSGPFTIAAVGASGSGHGDLDGRRFTFGFATP